MDKGHLFVIRGDLAHLAADHLLLPCDDRGNMNPGFGDLLEQSGAGDTIGGKQYVRPTFLEELSEGATLWPRAVKTTDGSPQVWVIDTTVETNESVESLVGNVVAAIKEIAGRSASAAPLGIEPIKMRPTRIGLPLYGVGAGGFHPNYAEMIDRMVAALDTCASEEGVDIVLTLRKRSDYAAVQSIRRRQLEGVRKGELSEDAKELAKVVAHGDAVLFIGAGASADSGSPTWNALLDFLGSAADLNSEEKEGLATLDARDQAIVLAQRIADNGDQETSRPGGADQRLRMSVADRLGGDTYSLIQGLLASLNVREAITTNYDRQYENARQHGDVNADGEDSGQLSVLPRETPKPGRPWLLKIHGDVVEPSSIVISRDDYLRFDRDRSPAAAVVQSRMLTAHLIFVGYSVSDENIVRLAREVQLFRAEYTSHSTSSDGALSDRIDGAVGTVLSPDVPQMKKELWSGILRFSDLSGFEADDQLRKVLLMLDQVAIFACRDVTYYLDKKYADLVGGASSTAEGGTDLDQGALAGALHSLGRAVTRARQHPESDIEKVVAKRAESFLKDLGWKPESPK